jgi:hypothetical protein
VLVGGAWGYDGSLRNGAAYLVLGPVSGKHDLSAADAIFVAEARDDYAGWSVAIDGDVDADGVFRQRAVARANPLVWVEPL